MKLLTSGWVLAALAALLNIGTTGGLIYFERGKIFGASADSDGIQAPPRFWSFRADDVESLISELRDGQAKLLERQAELDKVSAHLDAEKQELDKTRADISAMQDQITAEIPQIQDSERKNLKTLAQTYSTMTPGATVAIFRDLDEMLCVKVLSLMKPDKVGAILEQMSQDEAMTKRAASISDKLRLMMIEPKPQT